jgi:hypothetical protein
MHAEFLYEKVKGSSMSNEGAKSKTHRDLQLHIGRRSDACVGGPVHGKHSLGLISVGPGEIVQCKFNCRKTKIINYVHRFCNNNNVLGLLMSGNPCLVKLSLCSTN